MDLALFEDLDLSEFQIKLQIIELAKTDKRVPVLVCERRLVEVYFNLCKQRDSVCRELNELSETHVEYRPLLKVYKELKARIHRLEKAIYFKCEETGDLRLLSSLVLHEGKIISTIALRRIHKQKAKEEAVKLKKQKQEARKTWTELQCKIADGEVTKEEFEQAISYKVTKEEWDYETDIFYKFGGIARLPIPTKEYAQMYLEHKIIMKRIWKERARQKAKKYTEKMMTFADHPVMRACILAGAGIINEDHPMYKEAMKMMDEV